MAYDVLIDYIIREGEGKKEQILTEAKKNADAMLSDMEKRREALRDKKINEIENEIAEYRAKELNRALLKGKAFISVAKGEIIDAMYRELHSALQTIIGGPSYPAILRQLLIEALQDMGGKVYVLVNSGDCQIIKDLLKDMSITRCEVISITPDDRIEGGVEILSHDKSISIINTLWSRLEKVKEDLLPEIGKILFPINHA